MYHGRGHCWLLRILIESMSKISHSIDLLNAVSPECFEELIPKGTESSNQYEGYDMSCIEAMVEFLQYRLDSMDVSGVKLCFQIQCLPL